MRRSIGCSRRSGPWDGGAWSRHTRKNSAYDLTFSAHKSLSLAVAFAQTRAEQAALCFPGIAVPGLDKDAMSERGRALRRFDYAMSDVLLAPAYLLPPKPEIITAKGGRVVWRGSAGALDYSIERSPDPRAPESWEMVCDECTDDANGPWQDPSPPRTPAWYRVMPFNINGHKAMPSEPVANH